MEQGQKILVTGSGGQLGSEIKRLSFNFPQYQFLFPADPALRIDDFIAVSDFFEQHRPDWCINCAAYTAVDQAESDAEQAMLVNGKAVGRIAAVCRKFNSRLIHISTDYVFDGTATHPYKEDAATNPQNVYGVTKLKGEQLAVQENPETIIIRTSWVYSQYGKNFVKTMLRLQKEKPAIRVVNDQFGAPTYAADLASAILSIISEGNWIPGIFHFSNSGKISWFEFATTIKQLTGSSCIIDPIPAADFPTPAKRPGYSVMDLSKIKTLYQLHPRPWPEALKECLELLR